jgi:hypothetical protein
VLTELRGVIPKYAVGIFHVRESGLVEQLVIFNYYDQEEEYKSIVESDERIREEKALLTKNMQFYLDQEEVYINGERVYPRVVDVELGFQGDYKHPYILFLIVFRGNLKKGINIYEDRYEPEVVEYDYRVYWIFPPGVRVLSAQIGVPYRLLDKCRILVFDVKAGSKTSGYERIEFEI